MSKHKKYTILNFVVDALLTLVTGGLWLIYVFARELRNHG